jgi:hypothetical protein
MFYADIKNMQNKDTQIVMETFAIEYPQSRERFCLPDLTDRFSL